MNDKPWTLDVVKLPMRERIGVYVVASAKLWTAELIGVRVSKVSFVPARPKQCARSSSGCTDDGSATILASIGDSTTDCTRATTRSVDDP